MGLLLCTKDAVHPLYYEKLDIDIWSIQELCYVIYHYPVMIPEDYVDRKLINWIRDELGLGLFAAKLEQLLAGGESQENLLLAILAEGNYYTAAEISRYKSELKRLRSIEPQVFAELLGDTFFRMGRFGKAVKSYQDAASDAENLRVKEKLATAYVRVLQFEKAAALYAEVYEKNASEQALKQLYFISRIEPSSGACFKSYAEHVSTDRLAEWEMEFEAVRVGVDESERVEKIKEVFAQEAEERRAQTARLIRKWKREYREKV